MVYSAFSAAVVGGIWKIVSIPELLLLLVVCMVLLAVVHGRHGVRRAGPGLLQARRGGHRVLRLQKSLATGVPMAGILFPGATAGILVLPLMLFHPDPADGLLGDRPALRRAAGRRGLTQLYSWVDQPNRW